MEISDKNSIIKKSSIAKENLEEVDYSENFNGTPSSLNGNPSFNNKNKFNEDNALEMVELEFKDLEDWLKKECKRLKSEAGDICETIRIEKP